MSTIDDPNPLNQACENGAACPQPALPESVVPQLGESQPTPSLPIVPQANSPQAAAETVPEEPADAPARPQKAAVLPEIARLSLEGHSNRAIGRKLGVPRRTVDRWLREQRQEWSENAAKSSVELYAVAMARLEAVYREAMEAWRSSLEDKQVIVETLSGDDEKTKGTLRKTTQPGKAGQAALLGQAIRAAIEISNFNAKHTFTAQKVQQTEDGRARRILARELSRLPTRTFRDFEKLLRIPEEHRSPSELAEVVSNLSAAEYSKLEDYLSKKFGRFLPPAELTRIGGEGAGRKAEGTRMESPHPNPTNPLPKGEETEEERMTDKGPC